MPRNHRGIAVLPSLVLFAISLSSLSAGTAAAQTVTNPRIVEFFPSPDHNVVLLDGRAAVTKYLFEVYLQGASAPFHTIDLAKPAPQSDGLVRYDFSTSVAGWPLPGGVYESRVAAAGPFGTSRSSVSNPFTISGGTTCAFTVSPTSASVAAGGGTASVTVTTTTGCGWTATSGASWVTASPASGTGSGLTILWVASNATATARTATVMVAGRAVTVTQAGTLSAGLAAAYGFDEGAGTTTTDASGNGNTGSLSGATWTTQGRFGGALSFDGASLVTIADAGALDLATGMTIEAWVYPTGRSTWQSVALKEQPGGLAYGLFAASSGANVPGGYVATFSELDVAGPSTLPLDAWSHLALTHDGSTLRLYVNGREVASRMAAGNLPTSSGALRIGGNDVWGDYFQGRIDEVRVYRRALSEVEVQNDMNAPVAGETRGPLPVTETAAFAGVAGGATATAATLVVSGDGLRADYYDNQDFTGLVSSQVDAKVDFDWAMEAPAPRMRPDGFTIRWSGRVLATHSEVFTFHTVADDGVRLWVNGQLVIDDWDNRGLKENSARLGLVAGETYTIELEYLENSGAAVARLLWSSPSAPKAVVPQACLYSTP